jgi:hypothetical protein
MAHNCTIREEETLVSGRSVLTTFKIICDKCGLIEKARTERDAKARAQAHVNMPHKR